MLPPLRPCSCTLGSCASMAVSVGFCFISSFEQKRNCSQTYHVKIKTKHPAAFCFPQTNSSASNYMKLEDQEEAELSLHSQYYSHAATRTLIRAQLKKVDTLAAIRCMTLTVLSVRLKCEACGASCGQVILCV